MKLSRGAVKMLEGMLTKFGDMAHEDSANHGGCCFCGCTEYEERSTHSSDCIFHKINYWAAEFENEYERMIRDGRYH